MPIRIAVACWALLPTLVCFAADWPQWGGRDGRNMAASERNLPSSFIPGDKRSDGQGIEIRTTHNVKWAARLGSETYSTPVIASGMVFIGTNDFHLADPRYKPTEGGLLLCLDEATGNERWRLVVPKLISKQKSSQFDEMNLGIVAAAAVEGERAYVVTNRCEVVCLDTRGMANGNDGPFRDEGRYAVGPGNPPVTCGPGDADIIWRYDMISGVAVWPHDASNCGVLLHGDLLYVCTNNGVDGEKCPFPDSPSLIALDKRSGRLVACDDEQIGKRCFHGQWSSPSLGKVGGKTLIFFGGGDGVCYAFEALSAAPEHSVTTAHSVTAAPVVPLKKVWSFRCNPPQYLVRNGKPVDYWDGDSRKHRGNHDDGKFAGPSEIIGTPVFYKNRVYVTIGQDPRHGRGRGMLQCIDATGHGDISASGRIWSYDKLDRSLSTVSIADGLLYVADRPGVVHCLDAATGHCYWTYDTHAEIWGSTLVADGKLYVGSKKGLWILAAGREAKVLGQVRLGSPVWSTPVAANGVLYVASQKYLWAVQNSAQPSIAGIAKKVDRRQ
jgi:outer membrane protein assembly factor BamB